MELINIEQFNNIPVSKKGRKTIDKWLPLFIALPIGSGYLIKKDEWGRKYGPSSTLGSYCYHKNSALFGKKFTVKTLLDKSGWAVMRVG